MSAIGISNKFWARLVPKRVQYKDPIGEESIEEPLCLDAIGMIYTKAKKRLNLKGYENDGPEIGAITARMQLS